MRDLFPLVTTDIALFSLVAGDLVVLIGKRANAPSRGRWALPGGVLNPEIDRSLEETARRILCNKMGVEVPVLEQVITVSGPKRDPRGYSVSTLFYALLPCDLVQAVAGDKTEEVIWATVDDIRTDLAFDHNRLLEAATLALRDKVARRILPLHLLPAKFTLTDVQRASEAILGHTLDKAAFRRLLKDENALIPLPGEFLRGPQRPAQLYARSSAFRFQI